MIGSMAYEERYGFNPAFARLLFICVAFVVAGLVFKLPLVARIIEFVVFGGGAIVLTGLGLRATRRVVLRVDHDGVALDAEELPWSEVRSIKVGKLDKPPYAATVTVARRGNRPPLVKPVQGWKLNSDRLRQAVTAFAPKKVGFSDDR
jgi:hypothetical protein